MPKSICKEELGRHAPIATKSIVEETCGGSLEFLFSMKPCYEAPMMVNHNLLTVIILKILEMWSYNTYLKMLYPQLGANLLECNWKVPKP